MTTAQTPTTEQQITPRPMPTEMLVRVADLTDGTKSVQLSCNTFHGVLTFFLPAEMAEQVGQGLQDAARQARTGLTIVGGMSNGGA